MGIHTGSPQSFEDDWHGTDVDTAARVEALSTGKQILLSPATFELVHHMTDVKFHRVGEFLLKGIDRLILWEADWDGTGPRHTARSSSTPDVDQPASISGFVGRTAYLGALLGKPGVSLLPLQGADGGVELNRLYVNRTFLPERRGLQTGQTPRVRGQERALSAEVPHEIFKRIEADLWEKLEERRRILVEAPAWTGKSTLCRWLLHHCSEHAKLTPIFIIFREFSQSGKSLRQYLEEDYAEWLVLSQPVI